MLNKLILSGALLWGAVLAHAELALVATLDNEVYTKFEARAGEVWGISPQGVAVRLPSSGGWSLGGDFLANAKFARFSADYEIARAVVPTGHYVKETRMIGTVFVHRNDDWLAPEYENAIAVLAWMKDGEPLWVEVEAARVTNGPSWAYAAMFVRELAGNERAGYPILFLLKEGEFVAARSEFADERLNAVLAAAHLGSKQDLSDALQRIESPNERSTETELSLLGMVAKTGRLELVKTLLASGAEIDFSAYKPHSALGAAALKGRVEVVEHLLQQSTEKEAKRMCANLLPMLAAKGQLETALVLIEADFRKDANTVLQVALSLREVALAKRLLALEIWSPLYGVEQESLVAAAATGDADLLRQLVKVRMKGSTKSYTSTALIAAVQSGRVDAVEVLLKAKAKPEAKDRHGFRAIDYAAVSGDETMVALLRRYGGKPALDQGLPSRPNMVGRVHRAAEVDALPELLEQKELISSRVGMGNTLVAGTSLGRSFRYPRLYFARIGPNRVPRDRISEDGADVNPHGYVGPSLYGAVSMLVDSTGIIADIEVIPYVGNSKRILEFDRRDDDKRIAAVLAHRFEPGRVNGEAVATRVTLPLLVQDY